MHGIGGSTIEQARECLSAREVQVWSEYRYKHGSFNVMQRADYNAGLMASLYANSKRKQGVAAFSPYDFMRYQSQEGLTLEQAMSTWG